MYMQAIYRNPLGYLDVSSFVVFSRHFQGFPSSYDNVCASRCLYVTSPWATSCSQVSFRRPGQPKDFQGSDEQPAAQNGQNWHFCIFCQSQKLCRTCNERLMINYYRAL